MILSIILILVLSIGIICESGSYTTREPREESVGWHRIHGTHQVVYPDGQVSQPFTFEVAKQYQELFGGYLVNIHGN